MVAKDLDFPIPLKESSVSTSLVKAAAVQEGLLLM